MGLAPIIGDLIGTMFGVVGPEWRLLTRNAVSASAAPVCLYAWAAPPSRPEVFRQADFSSGCLASNVDPRRSRAFR